MYKMKKTVHVLRKVLLGFAVAFILLALSTAALFAYLTATEYKPGKVEKPEIIKTSNGSTNEKASVSEKMKFKELKKGREVSVLSWNIGYGALGDDADFFLDGGKEVRASSQERVKENLKNIVKNINKINADINMFQEVDVNSRRSYGINQSRELFSNAGKAEGSFATNYKVPFIPYPLPPIGKVEAGIQIQTKYHVAGAFRNQLPVPFGWPERLGNLKRCLLINRIPLKGGKKELVIVNLHLEAYDDGEGKQAQTDELFKVLEDEKKKGSYVIAGGDFNQTFSSANMKRYNVKKGMWKPGIIDTNKYKKDWQFVMDDKIPSCRSLDKPLKNNKSKQFQYYIIDGYILSKNVKLKSCRNINLEFKNADHNPVLLKVVLQ